MTDSRARAQFPVVEDGFDAVYEREFAYVWRTVRRFGVPDAEIPDAVHDVFVVVLRRWQDYDPARPIGPWLFGIARRVAAARRRAPGGVAGTSDSWEGRSREPPADQTAADRQLLWRALGQLSEDRLLVFVLHDLEGHSAPEIAEQLAIPANTVYSRLRLARDDLSVAVARIRREEDAP